MNKAKTKVLDERTRLALARVSVLRAQGRAERAKEEILKQERQMPKVGSRWQKHQALLGDYEAHDVWCYRHMAWSERGQQVAVLETEIDGKPYFRVLPMDTLFLEFVEVEQTKPKGKR